MNTKCLRGLCGTLLLALLSLSANAADDYTPHYRLINNPDYPTNDLAVATYNLMDYGVDNTGHKDCTATINLLLKKLAGIPDNGKVGEFGKNWQYKHGGTLYIPAGRYLITGQIQLPCGITIRGDWKKPTGTDKLTGTILMIRPKASLAGTTAEEDGAVLMQPTSELSNLTFWYPDQSVDNVTPYPPTIVYGFSPRYWGNDYTNTRHVTLVNSYIGIQSSEIIGGGCPNAFDVYGTPLHEGVVIDNIADVGRLDWISFSPKYWASSGLEGSPDEGAVRSWTRANATGIVMGRNDWSYACNYTVDGYNIGFHAIDGRGSYGGRPNGQNYAFNINDCATGIKISSSSNSGIMFTRVTTTGCDIGIHSEAGIGPVQFYGCTIGGSQSVYTERGGSVGLLFQDCTFNGRASINGAHYTSVNGTYNSDITIGPNARSIMTGNTFANGAQYINKSLYRCRYSEAKVTTKPLPEYKPEWMEIRETRPARAALYVVTDSEFGAKPVDIVTDLASQPDNSAAIQKALDKAGREGGGIVYLPAGHYRMDHGLTIPTGVELKGAGDIASVPKGNGSILEVYRVNEGNENAAPFINMGVKSGIRGVHFNYPSQDDIDNVKKYPYTIRGNKDCYIVNVAARTAYRLLDLFTNKCDNHYVDYLAGHAFRNIIRVGGGSENGVITNTQCNTIAYGCGDENKFGCWPNSEQCKQDGVTDKIGSQNKRELDFLMMGDCRGEVLYNNFLVGCNKGMHFFKDDNGRGTRDCHAMGNAVDGAVNTFVFDGMDTDLDLINSQVVSSNHTDASDSTNVMYGHYLTLAKGLGHTVNMFSSNLWGSGTHLADVLSGRLNIYLTNMAASGSEYTFNVADGAKATTIGGYIQRVKKITTDKASSSRTSIFASVVDETGLEGTLADDSCNLPIAWDMSDSPNTLPRTGWTASSNVMDYIAFLALDGNADTRWSLYDFQVNKAGAWFNVDMHQDCTFNTIILNSVASPNDGPAAYKVEVYRDGNWEEVATGSKGGAITVVTLDKKVTASQVRITLMDNDVESNYWSIHEFYLANLDMETTDVKSIDNAVGSLGNDARAEVYNLDGIRIATAGKNANALHSLPKGIYIIRYISGGKTVKTVKTVVK